MHKYFSRSNTLLIIASLIWGCAFVAQNVGMNYIGPWTFCSARFLIAGISLILIMPLLEKIQPKSHIKNSAQANKELVFSSLICGVALAIGSGIQQMAMVTVPVAKAGFLTTLYVLLVPVLSLFLGHRIKAKIWVGIVIALVGLYLLSMAASLTLGVGEVLLIGCALIFAIHIIVIGHYSVRVDPVKLSCGQFLVSGVITFFPAILIEKPVISSVLAAYIPLLYTGIFSSSVAYTLQIFAQKGASPTIAGMLLSLESVFAAIAGYLILHQTLTVRELIGCVLIFVAIVIAQFPDRRDMVNVTQ